MSTQEFDWSTSGSQCQRSADRPSPQIDRPLEVCDLSNGWYNNYTLTIPLCLTLDIMGFEYDPDKSAENKRKHGIDFEEAQKLWADSGLVEIPARTTDELRWLLIGTIEQKHWSAIITRRGDNIRIISVRRSRVEEVTFCESEDI